VYPAVLEELLPAAWHRTEQYANNRLECDHGRLNARLGPMPDSSRTAAGSCSPGMPSSRTYDADTTSRGRGAGESAAGGAFDELALAI
jgi:transposase-like protein